MPPKSQATNKKRRAVDDDAYGGRPSTKQRPPATKAGKMVPKPQQVKLTAPKIPPNAATINKENRLDMALDNLPKRFSRPWYFYDAVDPVPKFRHLGAAAFAQRKHQPDVSEGEKSEELSDHPGDDTLPVFVFGYRQKYSVTLLDPKKDQATLFDYGEDDLVTIAIYPVIRDPQIETEDPELVDPQHHHLGARSTYEIHAGYRRVIIGFNREIEFMTVDGLSSHNCLSRAVYLIKILDAFAAEVMGKFSQRKSDPRFRSAVLNPILQRQLHGVNDSEATSVQQQVGDTVEQAVEFYLLIDPLDPAYTLHVMHNILYVWPVRLSLGLLGVQANKSTFDNVMQNTQVLMDGLVECQLWKENTLYEYELNIVRVEHLEVCYKRLIEASGLDTAGPSANNRNSPAALDKSAASNQTPIHPAPANESDNPMPPNKSDNPMPPNKTDQQAPQDNPNPSGNDHPPPLPNAGNPPLPENDSGSLPPHFAGRSRNRATKVKVTKSDSGLSEEDALEPPTDGTNPSSQDPGAAPSASHGNGDDDADT